MKIHGVFFQGDVLGALKLNLENKSRVYLDPALAGIFLLNNYYFVLTSLDRQVNFKLIKCITMCKSNSYNF